MAVDLIGAAAGSLAVAGATLVGRHGIEAARGRRRHGHLARLIDRRQGINVVLPSIPIESFPVRHLSEPEATLHASPPNVLFMPLNEGVAIGRLSLALRSVAGKAPVNFVSCERFNADERPIISIGGPSVNVISGRLLEEWAPSFAVDYPDATCARIGSTTFGVAYNSRKEVTEDWGFILTTRSRANDQPLIVLCGVLAFGTQIATQALMDLRRLHATAAQAIASKDPAMIVVNGKVDGFGVHDLDVRQVIRLR